MNKISYTIRSHLLKLRIHSDLRTKIYLNLIFQQQQISLIEIGQNQSPIIHLIIFMQEFNNQAPLLQNDINPFAAPSYNLSPEMDIRQSQSYAADANPLNEQKNSNHVKSLIATLLLWIGIPTIVVLTLIHSIQLETGALAGICAGIYILYLILAMCCNPLLSYLNKIEHGNRFREEYKRVQGLAGHFAFSVECYHYETRYHTRTVSDGNGGTKTQTYTTTQKVVTHRNSQNVYPVNTRDDSGDVDNVRALTLVVFIHYFVNYRFTDESSRQNFDYQWHVFRRNNTRDAHQDFRYVYVVPGLIERMAFSIGQKKPNWCGFLVFWSVIGLIWPYSMWIQTKISRYNINFLKVLTMGRGPYKY